MAKKNFKFESGVMICGTASDLDGRTGTIIGKCSEHATVDFYIVLLVKPLKDGTRGVMMIESCLDGQISGPEASWL